MKKDLKESLLKYGCYHSNTTDKPLKNSALASLIFGYSLIKNIANLGNIAKKNKYSHQALYQASFNIMRTLEKIGIKISVKNADVLNTFSSPCIFVANHMSSLDGIILPSVILPFRELTFVIKNDLLNIPKFSNILSAMNAIAISQRNMKDDLKKILKESAQHLQNNRSIVIFPQGAREDDLAIEKFNHIGILIAKKYHVPIVPIAIHTNAWKPGRIIKDCGRIDPTKKVQVCFGTPRTVSGDGKDDHIDIFNFIKNLVNEWNCGI